MPARSPVKSCESMKVISVGDSKKTLFEKVLDGEKITSAELIQEYIRWYDLDANEIEREIKSIEFCYGCSREDAESALITKMLFELAYKKGFVR